MAERLDARQWSAWWEHGSITSFEGAFSTNYDGPIKHFWERCFSRLPAQANIVDLGTGNGALVLLAADYSRQHDRDFHITGIDFADIHPASFSDERIRFISNRPMEDTGLDAQSQDLVISQFGFEYGNMQTTLKEIKRLLKPGTGHFCAMMHHQHSVVLKQAREALAQIKRCENSGLLEIATNLVALQEELARNSRLSYRQQEQAKHLHQQFSQGLEKLSRYTRQLKDPSHAQMFIHNLKILFDRRNATRFSPGQRLQAIERLRIENDNYQRRMKDLRSASCSDDDFKILSKNLKQLGFKVEQIAPQQYHGQHFCHRMMAHLPVS